MATQLDLISKKKRRLNSGYQKSHFDFSKITGVILAPKGHTITLSSDIATQLAADGIQADVNDRIFALPPVVGFTDQTSEDKKTSFGYGGEHYSGYGTYQGLFEFADAKKSLQKILSRYNKLQNYFTAYLVDENGFLLCTKKAGETNPRGFSLQSLWAPKWTFSGENGTKLAMFISFLNASELNEDLHVVECGFDVLGTVNTVTDVDLEVATVLGTNTAGQMDVYVKTGDGEESLLDDYGSTLAATAMWSATNQNTGLTITISTASLVTIGSQRAVRLTFTTNLPATTGHKFTLQGAAMSVWSAAGVTGFEVAEPLTITIP